MKKFILRPGLYRIIEIFCGLFHAVRAKLVTIKGLSPGNVLHILDKFRADAKVRSIVLIDRFPGKYL